MRIHSGASLPPPVAAGQTPKTAPAGLTEPTSEAPAGPDAAESAGSEATPTKGLELSPEVDEATRAAVAEMAQRDREVRAHEAAHAMVGGTLAGAASFTYQTGPDGRSYAVAGEVPISLGGGGSASERAANARQARAAALAPADPSGADRAIAAQASRIEAEARAEMAAEARAEVAAEAQEEAAPEESGDATAADETEASRGKLEAAYHQHGEGQACAFCAPEPDAAARTL